MIHAQLQLPIFDFGFQTNTLDCFNRDMDWVALVASGHYTLGKTSLLEIYQLKHIPKTAFHIYLKMILI